MTTTHLRQDNILIALEGKRNLAAFLLENILKINFLNLYFVCLTLLKGLFIHWDNYLLPEINF